MFYLRQLPKVRATSYIYWEQKEKVGEIRVSGLPVRHLPSERQARRTQRRFGNETAAGIRATQVYGRTRQKR